MNRAVQCQLASSRQPDRRTVAVQRKCACGSSKKPFGDMFEECQSRIVQPKLFISTPDDPFEKEADGIAEQVATMRGDATGQSLSPARVHQLTSPATAPAVSPPAGVYVSDRVEALSNGGKNLPDSARRSFDAHFGVDFSHVRIHTGPDASRLAASIDARAFTWGHHIVFAEGEYDPESQSGRRLLAHELTHTIQQGAAASGSSSFIQREVTSAPARDCTKSGFTFKPAFTGIVNDKQPRKANRFVPREYYSEIPGSSKSQKLGSLVKGQEVTVGPTGGYAHLWRQVCAKSEHLPAQTMWVLNDYIDEKRVSEPKTAKSEKHAPPPGTIAQPDEEMLQVWLAERSDPRADPFARKSKTKQHSWVEWLEAGNDAVRSIETSHYPSEEARLADLDRLLLETASRRAEFKAQRMKAIAYRLRLVDFIAELKRRERQGPEERPSTEWKAPPGTIPVDVDYSQPVPYVEGFSENTYIDNKITHVGVRLMDGTYHAFIEGRDSPLTIPASWILTGGEPIPVNDRVYGSREDAIRAIGPRHKTHFAYWKAEGGFVLPSHFAQSNAPRFMWGAQDAIREAAAYGEGVFSGVLRGLIEGKAIEFGMRGLGYGTKRALEKYVTPSKPPADAPGVVAKGTPAKSESKKPAATKVDPTGKGKPTTEGGPTAKGEATAEGEVTPKILATGKSQTAKSKGTGKGTGQLPFRDKLSERGLSDDAISALERAGFNFRSSKDRNMLLGVASSKSRTFVDFANNFHDSHGVTQVLKEWKLGGKKRDGANLVMRRAMAAHRGRKVEFERPGGKAFGKGGEYAPRKADIVVHPETSGQRTQFEEVKSWAVDPAGGRNSISKNWRTVESEMAFDVAAFETDFRWIFEAKKVVAPSGVPRKQFVVDNLLPVVKKSGYLVTKLGPSDDAIRRSLDRIVVIQE